MKRESGNNAVMYIIFSAHFYFSIAVLSWHIYKYIPSRQLWIESTFFAFMLSNNFYGSFSETPFTTNSNDLSSIYLILSSFHIILSKWPNYMVLMILYIEILRSNKFKSQKIYHFYGESSLRLKTLKISLL